MGKRLKRILPVLALGYMGMCTIGMLDGGATKGMPSRSSAAAERSGMLVKRLTVLNDSGPPGIHEAWLELPAYTSYWLGFWPRRRPLRYYGEGTRYLLSIALPDERVQFGDSGRGGAGKMSLGSGDTAVVAWDVVGPVPDTIVIRARQPGQNTFPVHFGDGRAVADAAPQRP